MTEPYFYSDPVARLQVLLEEVTRAKPGSPQTRFVLPEGNAVDRLSSDFHHVLYGRRGTGKSSLLRHVESTRVADGRLVAWADQETYMGLTYPDVLVGTLADTFRQFAKQVRSGDPGFTGSRRLRRRRSKQDRLLADRLDQAVAQLLDLKHAPAESEIEWTASYAHTTSEKRDGSLEGSASKGWFKGSLGRKRSDEATRGAKTDYAHRYRATKAEHLEKAVSTYRDLMQAAVAGRPNAFIMLDDFYRLADVDQPRIAGYFHRVTKDTGAWLKIGSIRYWTRLYAGGSPAVGLQAPHDVRELSLDRGLLDFHSSKRFLEQILSALAAECGVDLDLLFSDGALDRLALAAGGVPRDYIGLVSDSIAVAKNRGLSKKAGTERIIAEDVNEAAGRTVEAKFNDLTEDAGGEARALRELVVEITNHCRSTGSACFLVDFREAELVARLNRLQTMRFVHAIDDNETLPDPQSSRYSVFVLDVSQLAAQRAWQVDFMGWTKREKRRARRLVFSLEAGVTTPTPTPRVPITSDAEHGLQLALDDELAVVAQVEAAVQPPAV